MLIASYLCHIACTIDKYFKLRIADFMHICIKWIHSDCSRRRFSVQRQEGFVCSHTKHPTLDKRHLICSPVEDLVILCSLTEILFFLWLRFIRVCRFSLKTCTTATCLLGDPFGDILRPIDFRSIAHLFTTRLPERKKQEEKREHLQSFTHFTT